jgi:hypothetical protein
MIKKRSQTAIEFMLITGLILVSFTGLMIAIQSSTGSKVREKNQISVEQVALAVQDEINLASKSSDGYFRSFKIPSEIVGMSYSISLKDSSVYIITTDSRYSVAYPIKNVTINNIYKGWNNITKQNGEIILNP